MTGLETREAPPEVPTQGQVDALQRRIDELTACVEARDAFIAVTAHELRNPMTPIVGQLDLLLIALRTGRCPPAVIEEKLERLQHVFGRYVKRTGILLNVSRMTSGKLQLSLEPCDVAEVLREVVAEYEDEAQRAGVLLTVTAAERLPGTWDRLAIEQIIDNLLSNALKYGGRTPVILTAGSRVAPGPGGQDETTVSITVRDHGSGIRAADRAGLWGRFGGGGGLGEGRGGFGVGLWVVNQLALAMDGAVAVEDAPGGGALFTVTLPQYVRERQG